MAAGKKREKEREWERVNRARQAQKKAKCPAHKLGQTHTSRANLTQTQRHPHTHTRLWPQTQTGASFGLRLRSFHA